MPADNLPNTLYHGTRASALPSILADGLRPRAARRGNWKHSVESNPQAVYLTNAYPLYFAASAARQKDAALLILELSGGALDLELMAPDEDFLEQATRGSPNFAAAGGDMKARTRWFRRRALRDFSHYWRDSLRHLGTCTCYGRVPAQAVTRYAVVPIRHPLVRASDPTITLMNYKIMGGYYRQLVRHIFGDPLDLEDLGVVRDRAAWLRGLDRAGIIVKTLGTP